MNDNDNIDPDNPPLTGKEVWGSWGDRIKAKLDEHKARYEAYQHALRMWEDDGGNVIEARFPHAAHAYSMHNRRFLMEGGEAGCFYCLKTFHPTTITEWIDNGSTALCPHCNIDSVLPSIVAPIDSVFLRQMHAYWFRGV